MDDEAVAVLLRAVHLRSRFHSHVEVHEPWAATMPPFGDCVSFHLVLAGRCVVWTDDQDVTASSGELVLIPHGRGHHLGSARGEPSLGRVDLMDQEYVTSTFSVMRLPGGGEPTRLLCGIAELRGPSASRLASSLPPLIHVDDRSPTTTTALRLALDLLAMEVETVRPGTAAVAPRLADVVVMLALRWWLEHGDGRDSDWIRALSHPDVGAALRAVHRDPAADWTVERLAREARLSRSAFAARFREVTGNGVMTHVTGLRMELAAERLREDPELSVARLASEVGYGSEAAFSRAFRRVVGHTPTEERRRVTATPTPVDA